MGSAMERARVRDAPAVMWAEPTRKEPESGLVSSGDVRLRYKLSKGDAGHDEHCASRRNEPEMFAGDKERGDPRKSGLEGEDERHRRSGQDGLRPALNGEGRSGGKGRCNEKRNTA